MAGYRPGCCESLRDNVVVKNTFLEIKKESGEELDAAGGAGVNRCASAPCVLMTAQFRVLSFERKTAEDKGLVLERLTHPQDQAGAFLAHAERFFEAGIDDLNTMQDTQYRTMLTSISPAIFQEELEQIVRFRTASGPEKTRISPDFNNTKARTVDVIDVAAVADNIQEDIITSSQRPAQMSAGSAGHPYSCTECNFYLFDPAGCRNGTDCKYCHDFHPRKNKSRNRRFLKRISGRLNEGAISPQNPTVANANVSREENTIACPQVDVLATGDYVKGQKPQKLVFGNENIIVPLRPEQIIAASRPPTISKPKDFRRSDNKLPAPTSFAENGDFAGVAMWYLNQSCGTVENLVITAGVPIHLEAHLQVSHSQRQQLEGQTRFKALQPLPQGLSVDPCTGVLYGTPVREQFGAPLVQILVTVPAIGPDGIRLGRVPFARCSLVISVVAGRSQ